MVVGPRSVAPKSRRERPAKPALSREGIVDTALTILNQEGLGKVTMRRIATALDTGPASLYVYVRDTEDLHASILDALIGRMTWPSPADEWRSGIHELLASYGEILFAYPEIARLTATTQPLGPHYLALVESVLDLLSEGGIPDDTAAWGVDILLSLVTATAVEHGTRPPGEREESLATMAATIAIASSESYPRITRLGDRMLAGTGAERFHWSLDVVIDGLLHTRRAPAASGTSGRQSCSDVEK